MHDTKLMRVRRLALGYQGCVALCVLTVVSLAGCRNRAPKPKLDRFDPETLMVSSEGAEYLPHEVIVRPLPGVTMQELRGEIEVLGGTIDNPDDPLAAQLGYVRITLPAERGTDQAISQLLREGLVEEADRNYLIKIDRTPDDPDYDSLWGMQVIEAPIVWDYHRGDPSVVVSVVDTGVDYGHPDLEENIWTNEGEIPGNGVDDDGNGYIDDYHGYDFCNEDGDPIDDHGHGTHVAGTIGAVGDNGVGVVGVNWRVKIQSLKFLCGNGIGADWDAARSLVYSAQNGARVVNGSFGGRHQITSYMDEAIRTLGEAGAVFVVAAGNKSLNIDHTPYSPAVSTRPNVVTVAASTPNDNLASFSNHGATNVDLAAPGTAIRSTFPGSRYATLSGTSMAAPHVAGASALLLSRFPDLTPEKIRQALMETSDPAPALQGKVGSEARLNLRRLMQTDTNPPAAPEGFAVTRRADGAVLASWSANDEEDLAGYRLRWGQGSAEYTESLVTPVDQLAHALLDLEEGHTWYFVVHALDASGNQSEASEERAIELVDELAPPTIFDLQARTLPGDLASGQVTTSSGEHSEQFAARSAFDQDPGSEWISPGRLEAQEEWLEILLDEPAEVQVVSLRASGSYPEFFPQEVQIELSNDGNSWVLVAARGGLSVDSGALLEFPFAPQQARYVRIRGYNDRAHASDLFFTGLAGVEVRKRAAELGAVQLTFLAPGDDPGRGRAARYELRYALAPFEESSFTQGTQAVTPEPAEAGLIERVVVADLEAERTYYFAIVSEDEAGNRSGMSNLASASTLSLPPDPVQDLRVTESLAAGLVLGWTAPQDQGSEQPVAAYELRYGLQPLDERSFEQATPVDTPTPATPGSDEHATVEELQAGVYYHFALRSVDAAGSRSALSNLIVATPGDGVDRIPPAAVTDLKLRSSLLDQEVALQWMDSSDGSDASALLNSDALSPWYSGSAAQDSEVSLRFDLGALTPLVEVATQPAALGGVLMAYPRDLVFETSLDGARWELFTAVQGLSPSLAEVDRWRGAVHWARYLRLRVTGRGLDQCGEGDTDCQRRVAIGTLEARALADERAVELSWISPGDDAWLGTATGYELRRSESDLTEGNFTQAEQLSTSLPQPAGRIEVLRVAGLTAERTHRFALRTHDEVGNVSGLSNVVNHITEAVPPAPVTDLEVVSQGTNQLGLRWTATGDDGFEGTASVYDLRLATGPISQENWAQAARINDMIDPSPPGSSENFVVTGLAQGTRYYLALQVLDELGGASPLSNLASGETLDAMPPARINDLVASALDPAQASPLDGVEVQSSTRYSSETEARLLLDGDPRTVWISAGSEPWQTETLSFVFSEERPISRVRLHSASELEDLFPAAFELQLRSAGGPWRTVIEERDLQTERNWEEWSVGSVVASEARVLVTQGARWAGSSYTALGEFEWYEDTTEYGSVQLAWTAPGDDEMLGQASGYDLRDAPTAIVDQSSFDSATQLDVEPSPGPVGSLERAELTGLVPGSNHCFGLVASDERGNRSTPSNSPCVTLPEAPPHPIVDLEVTEALAHAITLRWTTPEDAGGSSYQLRRADSRITLGNWDEATPVDDLPTPGAGGSLQTFQVSGLESLTTYHFALRTITAGDLASGLSNNAHASTADDVPPGTIQDLLAETDMEASGSLWLRFTAPGDNGPVGQADHYDLRYSSAPIDADNFSAATALQTPAPAPAGQQEQLHIQGLGTESLYYFALRAHDGAGNVSGLSNVASGRSRDEAPAQVSDLRLESAGSGNAPRPVLIWTSAGDDSFMGSAVNYQMRLRETVFSAQQFDSLPAFDSPPTPEPGGVLQRLTLPALAPDTRYHVALRAVDERGNTGAVSNVLAFTTADDVAPETITDLLAETGAARGQLRASWTAPGDNGSQGRASSYELRWATSPLDEGNFEQGTLVDSISSPRSAGSSENGTLSGLPDESMVYLRMRTLDDAGNLSPLSNLAQARTTDVSPGRVTDLRQTTRNTGSVQVTFTAPGDDGTSGRASEYELRWSSVPLSSSNFAAATRVNTPSPANAGSSEQVDITGLSANGSYYVALRSVDERGNVSSLSNLLQVATSDTLVPATISDLRAETGTGAGSVTLRWTAAGDDGNTGTAHSYQLRYADTPIGSAGWSGATNFPVSAAPRSAGSGEVLTVTGLEDERSYYFALRTVDDADNQSGISNSPGAQTPAVVPARVTDLRGSTAPGRLDLNWTATGDDGNSGTASRYELRYSTSLITAASFAGAIEVSNAPTPAASGSDESHTITGLSESTDYWVALVVHDDANGSSALSNVLKLTTPDLTAPGAVGSLVARAPTLEDVPFYVYNVYASSELEGPWEAPNGADGNTDTTWCSEASLVISAETLTLSFGSPREIDRIQLLPDADYPELLPRAFTIEGSTDGNSWQSLVHEQGFEAQSEAQWLSWGFEAQSAKLLRLRVEEPAQSFDRYYAMLSELQALPALPDEGQVELSWLAPGDDDTSGQVDRYEVYWSSQVFDESSLGSVSMTPGPSPNLSGLPETLSLGGLSGEATYYWAIRAIDEAGNVGPLSELVSAETNPVAPATVDDLSATADSTQQVTLRWTAPGDDGRTGSATSYEIRQADWTLTSLNFQLATQLSAPTPGPAGSTQQLVVDGLSDGTLYRFALIAHDEQGNASYLSNVAVARTAEGPDSTAPGSPSDLTARAPDLGGLSLPRQVLDYDSEQAPGFVVDNLVDGDHDSAWASQTRGEDFEEAITVRLEALVEHGQVNVWPAAGYTELFPKGLELLVSPDGLAWSSLLATSSPPADPSTPVSVQFADQPVQYVRLRVSEAAAPESGLYYAVIAELDVRTVNASPGTVQLNWTATGDDDSRGLASEYDLRAGPCPYDHDSASSFGLWAPAEPGHPERTRLTGLSSGSHCFGLRVGDEAGNWSPVQSVGPVSLD